MLFKTLTCVLAVIAVGEGGYILLHPHSVNRFKRVDDYGYAAFDTATGQLCRTYLVISSPKIMPDAPSSDRPSGSRSADPILDAIRSAPVNTQTGEDPQVEFIRRLPSCADIR
jgi:hypothetical protein